MSSVLHTSRYSFRRFVCQSEHTRAKIISILEVFLASIIWKENSYTIQKRTMIYRAKRCSTEVTYRNVQIDSRPFFICSSSSPFLLILLTKRKSHGVIWILYCLEPLLNILRLFFLIVRSFLQILNFFLAF